MSEGCARMVIIAGSILLVLLLILGMRSCNAETAFGVFVDRRWPELAGHEWEYHCAQMRDYGMNSACIYAYGVEDLREQVDIGVKVRLFHRNTPIFVCFNASPPGMGDPPFKMLEAAKDGATYGPCWPELIAYGMDESQSVNEAHKEMYDACRATGHRIGAGCVYPFVVPRIPFLDVVLVALISGGELETAKRTIEAYPREYGNYYVIQSMPTSDPYDTLRYYSGIWSWQSGAKYCMVWDYRRLLGYDERWPGDRMAQGFRDGVRDYHRLEKWCSEFQPEVKRER